MAGGRKDTDVKLPDTDRQDLKEELEAAPTEEKEPEKVSAEIVEIRTDTQHQKAVVVEYSTFVVELENIRTSSGELIGIEKEANLQRLYKLTSDLENLKLLFGIISDQGYEKFFIETVIEFLEKGYTLQDLLYLSRVKDTDGNDFLRHSNDIYKLRKKAGDPKEIMATIEAYVQCKDLSGRSFFRVQSNGTEGMETIADCIIDGHSVEEIKKFLAIADADGTSLFKDPGQLLNFFAKGGTVEYCHRLMAIKDHEEKGVFSGDSISAFVLWGGTIGLAEKLAKLQDNNGQTIYSSGRDMAEFVLSKTKISAAEDLIAVKDKAHGTLFRNGEDINDFIKSGGTPEDAEKYASIVDAESKPYFKGYEIAFLKKFKIPLPYIKKLVKKGLNAHTIILFYNLGLDESSHDYKQNGKPKALIVYPTSDPTQLAGNHFYDKDSMELLQKVIFAYDFKIRAISSTDELFDEEANVDLLWIGGHGSSKTLTLGEDKPKYGVHLGSKASIDKQTAGFDKFFAPLRKNSVVFLDACCCGHGREHHPNLANHLAQSLPPSTTLIASSDISKSHFTTVERAFPLKIRVSRHGVKDDTYTIQK